MFRQKHQQTAARFLGIVLLFACVFCFQNCTKMATKSAELESCNGGSAPCLQTGSGAAQPAPLPTPAPLTPNPMPAPMPTPTQPAPAYPTALTNLGLLGWKCVFNPDLTQPVTSLVSGTPITTPFSWNWAYTKSYGDNFYNTVGTNDITPFATSAAGLQISGWYDGSKWVGGQLSTVDANGNGTQFTGPYYVEYSFTAVNLPGTYAYMYGMHSSLGVTPFTPQAEFDFYEAMQTQGFSHATIHSDTSGNGAPNDQQTYFYGPSGMTWWGAPVTVGALWSPDGNAYWWYNGVKVGSAAIYSTWFNPTKNMWLVFGDFAYGSNPDTKQVITIVIPYIRVWQPASSN